MSECEDLPENIEELKALVFTQRAELLARDEALRAKREELDLKNAELCSHAAEIERLKLVVAKLQRLQFGRRSEKLDREIEQLELTLEELEVLSQPALAKKPASEEKTAPVRRGLPEQLPREQRVHEPACNCPDCGAAMRRIGEEVSEVLEYVPERFKVIRHVRPKHACPQCQRIVQVEAPSRPIARSFAGPGLLAHILTAKYSDHLPLYRQAQIYARQGVELDRSTMAEWVGGCTQLIEPLAGALARYVFAGAKLHADDTPVPVLDPGRGQTKTGRLWTYVRDDRPAASTDAPAVLFRYSPDRRGGNPKEHLKSFTGVLQADAYAGFGLVRGTHPGGGLLGARPGVPSTSCTRPTNPRSRPKRSGESARSTRSRLRSAGVRRMSEPASGRRAPDRCSTHSANGCARPSLGSRRSPSLPRRSATCSRAGRR